ncbi:unnamed protein product [Ectocarpus sp. 12 AP-2014]
MLLLTTAGGDGEGKASCFVGTATPSHALYGFFRVYILPHRTPSAAPWPSPFLFLLLLLRTLPPKTNLTPTSRNRNFPTVSPPPTPPWPKRAATATICKSDVMQTLPATTALRIATWARRHRHQRREGSCLVRLSATIHIYRRRI